MANAAPGATQRAASKFIIFENFEKLNTAELRQALKPTELAWVENLQPLAANNWATVPGPAPAAFTIPGETFSAFFFGVLNGKDYLVGINTLGGAWAFSTSGQTKFAPNGTFSQVPNQQVDMTSWEQDRFLFNDPVAGYSTWDGTTFAAVGGISPNIPLVAPGFGGSNYTSTPVVHITGGSGSGAAAVATVGPPAVNSLTFTSFGAGYSAAPQVHFSGGGGAGAAVTVTVDPQAVTALFNNGFPTTVGSYQPQAGTSPPFFIDPIFSPPSGVGGVTATGHTQIGVSGHPGEGGPGGGVFVQRVIVDNPGSGYASPPTIAFAPRTPMVVLQDAVMTVTGIGAGAINGITFTNHGSGYTSPPSVTIDPPTNPAPGGGGVTATANAVLGGGAVTHITLTNAGTGYLPSDNPPGGTLAITIDAPGGGGTTATADIRVLPQLPKGTSVAVFQGRAWLNFINQATGQLNGLQWSGTQGFDDFDVANASGALILADADLVHQITGLRAYNNFLWIVGDQSIKQIGNISIGGATNDETLFTILTLSSDQGTTFLRSCVSFNRVFFFANQNGIYAVFGSSVQKLSGDLDGIFQLTDFLLPPQAALVDIANVHCVAWLLRYNDPLSNPRSLFVIFDGKRWFPASQGNAINVVAGTCTVASPNWVPYASSGGDVTAIFNSATTPVPFQLLTALTHQGNPVQRKKTVRQGWAVRLETGSGTLQLAMQSDEAAGFGQTFTTNIVQGFQTRTVADPNVAGTYLGMGLQGVLTGFTLSNLRIEYQETNVGNQN